MLQILRSWSGLSLIVVLLGSLTLSGCQSWLNSRYANSLPPNAGVQHIKGLVQPVSIRRNALGIPLIEAQNLYDAFFSMGYVHASDRLSQMVSLRLLAQGRLSEMLGPGTLDIDRFMRSLNLKKAADALYRNASPRIKEGLEAYARGVNAYLFRHRDKRPMDLQEADYQPEYWKAEDSALIFSLLNFSLSMNLQEEIAALLLAQKVGAEKLPWLMPIYPDQALPFAEAEKLKGLHLEGSLNELQSLERTTSQIANLQMLGVAASNNWAIAPARSRGNKSILANDTHLPLAMPSLWNYLQIRTPHYQVAGVSVAGIPSVLAGFNGELAWGITMVMADNQDLYLEQIKRQGKQLYYLADGQWRPAIERQESFRIKGQNPQQETFYETRHGPLLNSSLRQTASELQPLSLSSRYGLAYQSIQNEPDRTLDALFDLSRARNLEQAFNISQEVRAIAVNALFADAQHIGWQVTGRFPNRKAGLGLLPSPGWDGDYDWDGYAEPVLHPADQDPPQTWLGSANQRSVQPGYGAQLSSSWYYPERYERLAQLASAEQRHDTQSMIKMQYDQSSLFVGKLQAMLNAPEMAKAVRQAIGALPTAQRQAAEEALKSLLAFDGKLAADSADAALYAAFLQESSRAIFLDELGPDDQQSWQALVNLAKLSYSAQADHLLGREDSPFWDDIRTAQREDKAAILARSLAAAQAFCESQLGQRSAWQWGKLHTYHWQSESSKLAPLLGASQRATLSTLSDYLNAGPYPAGGDHSTLNTSAYAWGENFNTWLIPAMRIVIDFAQNEPMIGLNSSGQSGNPASPHYADGIQAWQNGRYMSFPFRAENLDKVYGKQRLMLQPDR